MKSLSRVVIVGSGHAGVQLAASLRQRRWSGEVVLVGDESALPYHRPPLSKAYLAATEALEDIAIRSGDFYAKQDINLVQGCVTSIDRAGGLITLAGGEELRYSRLALCMGSRPRPLAVPGGDLPGVFYLRTVVDVDRIRAAAKPGSRAVIVGGGYVGLEVAASLRLLGLDVTVLEAAERVLERVTAPVLSSFFTRIHQEAGVDVRTGACVEAIGGDDRATSVELLTGEVVPADLVIVGIGVQPNTELAAMAGLHVDNGVVVDAGARTSDPDIVAAGDCTSHWMARYAAQIRLESVPNAMEQAKVAAATLCGESAEITALPWFWSDQYDLKLQIAGLNLGFDEVIVSGDPTSDRSFSCFYLKAGELIAADCVNRPRDFMFSKRAITQGLAVERSALAEGSYA